MPGYIEDPSLWRLSSNNGTVPLKMIDQSGEFEADQGSVKYSAFIPANQLVTFLQETFPPPIPYGDMMVPQSNPLPGLPGLTARRVSFKRMDPSLPIDPFGFDPTAPAGTYSPVIQVDVEYGLNRIQQPNPADPLTFLEISGDTTGDFFHTTAPKASWKRKTANPADTADSAPPGKVNNPRLSPTTVGTDPVKDPTVPIIINVPQTEWTVKWNQIPFTYFRDCLIYRLRWCLGRVNLTNFPVLFYAEPETLLFTGFNYRQTYTWRSGNIGTPPISIEMKFVEKRIIWDGVIKGHNDFWRPGVGWQYLLMNNGKPAYETREFGVLFQV